jgi:hypothetical protein
MKLFTPPIRRRLAAAAVVACGALFGAPLALACGTGGYSYAGLAASSPAFGIGATVTPLSSFGILSGHVAGWVGVGGPRQGPNGSDEWLQVGSGGFPELTGNDIYYELALPNRTPVYHQIAANLPSGKPARFAVLEMHNRPNVWRVSLNGPRLRPDHAAWQPRPLVADGDRRGWDGGTGAAATTFSIASIASRSRHAPGGWLGSPAAIRSAACHASRARNNQAGSFLARKAISPSARSPRSVRDQDRRPERRQLDERGSRRVRHPDAAVRDGLPEQLGRVGSVDPDDPPPGHSVSFE